MAIHSLQRAVQWKIGIYPIPITKALRTKRKLGDDDFEVETRNNPPQQVKVSATTVEWMCEGSWDNRVGVGGQTRRAGRQRQA